jgi:acyl-coenzyme A thioesterase PaaI-like protein
MSKDKKEITLSKMNWLLFLLSRFKIPMIGFVKPKLLVLNDSDVEVKIRLRRRSKNHLNSMYFGALAIGADVAAGIHTFYFSDKLGMKVSFAFKGMNAEFLKRAESDIIFKCDQGEIIKKAILKSNAEKVRINETVIVNAFDNSNEIVAKFDMIVSVKVK